MRNRIAFFVLLAMLVVWGVRAQDNEALLEITLATPAVIGDAGGTTNLTDADFDAFDGRAGAQLNQPGQFIMLPAADNIDLSRGELEFWYRPNYAAGAADDTAHHLITLGDVYNVPRFAILESDRLYLSITDASWTTYATSTAYHAPVWQAGEWVHLRALWNSEAATDALQLYVNGQRVDEGGASGGWDIGTSADYEGIFVGSANASGEFVADGALANLVIRGAPGQTSPVSPTADDPVEVDPTPIPSEATPLTEAPTVVTEGCIDRSDPSVIAQQPDVALPPVGQPFEDPRFCTTLRRVSDASERDGFETQEYSQLQAFSQDNAYLLLLSGQDGYIVRQMSDFSRVEGLAGNEWNAARWYPPQPHTLIHFDSNADTTLRVQLTNVDTGATETIFTFPEPYERIIANASSDELSLDGRWLAGIADRGDGEWVIFALDIQNGQLGAQLPINTLYEEECTPDPQWGNVTPDWVGVSPLGNYMVIQWTRDGTAPCSGLESRDLQSGAFVGRPYDGHQHGDLGVKPDGTEFFMTFENHPSGRLALGMRDLPGTATVAVPTYLTELEWGLAGHISCRGPAGMCLVTTYSDPADGWFPFEGEVFFQYTDGRVVRLAHHHSTACGYWVQPRASVSRDGRYVVFASDWGRANACEDLGRGDPYVLDVPSDLAIETMRETSDTAPPPEQSGDADSVAFNFEILDGDFRHGQRISIADSDADGDLDIILASSLNDAIYHYENDGAGSFTRSNLAPDNSIVAMETALADFDGDGDLDVAAVGLFDRSCEFCAPGTVRWYENTGDGWVTHVLSDGLWGARTVAAGDISGDGQPDIVVGSIDLGGSGNGIYWFEAGSGEGAIPVDATLPNVNTVEIVDVDGDGTQDILATSQTGNQVVWYDSQNLTPRVIAMPPGPYDIAVAELDGDSELEILVTSDAGVIRHDAGPNPADAWAETVIDPDLGYDGSAQLEAVDIDGDGLVDVAITMNSPSSGQSGLWWYRQNVDGTWARMVIRNGYPGITDVASGDLDGDGDPDLVTSTYEYSSANDELGVWWQE
ncbi:MAG: hypothetical protein GYB66_07610 [Chloroflexi bacterium]|nr:hypothetical protein [Chloroflexota bacterium]